MSWTNLQGRWLVNAMDAEQCGRTDKVADPPRKRVFISYAHDTVTHRRDVQALASLLSCQDRVQVIVDQWVDARRRHWPEWARRNIDGSRSVIVVASPIYKRAAEGDLGPEEHRGAQSEALLLQELLQQNRPMWRARILPVVLPAGSVDDIPMFLHPRTETHYVVPTLDLPGVEELIAAIFADDDRVGCDVNELESDGCPPGQAFDVARPMMGRAGVAPARESASSAVDASPSEREFGVIEWLGQPILWYQNGVRSVFAGWQARRREDQDE